jgi:hypothetical protein
MPNNYYWPDVAAGKMRESSKTQMRAIQGGHTSPVQTCLRLRPVPAAAATVCSSPRDLLSSQQQASQQGMSWLMAHASSLPSSLLPAILHMFLPILLAVCMLIGWVQANIFMNMSRWLTRLDAYCLACREYGVGNGGKWHLVAEAWHGRQCKHPGAASLLLSPTLWRKYN